MAITRKAHMLDQQRQQPSARTVPLHVPSKQARQVSQLIDIPTGAVFEIGGHGVRTELTAHVLEGKLGMNFLGSREVLQVGDCVVIETDETVSWDAAEGRCRVLAVSVKWDSPHADRE